MGALGDGEPSMLGTPLVAHAASYRSEAAVPKWGRVAKSGCLGVARGLGCQKQVEVQVGDLPVLSVEGL